MTDRDLTNLSKMFDVSQGRPAERASAPSSGAPPRETPTSSTPTTEGDTDTAAQTEAPTPTPKKTAPKKTAPKKTVTSKVATRKAPTREAAPKKPGPKKPKPDPKNAEASDGGPASATSTQPAMELGSEGQQKAQRAQIIMRIPTALFDKLKGEAEQANLSYGQITLLSVEQHLDAIRAEFAGRGPVSSSLFSATAYRPQAQERGVPKSPVNLHMSAADLDVLEQLWRDLPGCRDRNDLLSTAVRMHLSPDPEA